METSSQNSEITNLLLTAIQVERMIPDSVSILCSAANVTQNILKQRQQMDDEGHYSTPLFVLLGENHVTSSQILHHLLITHFLNKSAVAKVAVGYEVSYSEDQQKIQSCCLTKSVFDAYLREEKIPSAFLDSKNQDMLLDMTDFFNRSIAENFGYALDCKHTTFQQSGMQIRNYHIACFAKTLAKNEDARLVLIPTGIAHIMGHYLVDNETYKIFASPEISLVSALGVLEESVAVVGIGLSGKSANQGDKDKLSSVFYEVQNLPENRYVQGSDGDISSLQKIDNGCSYLSHEGEIIFDTNNKEAELAFIEPILKDFGFGHLLPRDIKDVGLSIKPTTQIGREHLNPS